MRKAWVLPLTSLLMLVVAAPVSAGANTSNTSGTGRTVYGEWSDVGVYGYAYFGQESGQPGFGDIYEESGEWVECQPVEGGAEPAPKAVAPTDTGPGEGYYGFVGTRTFGYAYGVEITLSRRLASGTVTGQVELWTETVDECAGIYGDGSSVIATIDVTATGIGPLASFRGSGSYKIPSEFNGHDSYRGTERQASGSVVAGTVIDASFDFGYMSRVTWTSHSNG